MAHETASQSTRRRKQARADQRFLALEEALQTVIAGQTRLESRLDVIDASTSRLHHMNISQDVHHLSERIATFEMQQEMRLHRIECLLFASDMAHFHKLDEMITSFRQGQPLSGNSSLQPEPETSPLKPMQLFPVDEVACGAGINGNQQRAASVDELDAVSARSVDDTNCQGAEVAGDDASVGKMVSNELIPEDAEITGRDVGSEGDVASEVSGEDGSEMEKVNIPACSNNAEADADLDSGRKAGDVLADDHAESDVGKSEDAFEQMLAAREARLMSHMAKLVKDAEAAINSG